MVGKQEGKRLKRKPRRTGFRQMSVLRLLFPENNPRYTDPGPRQKSSDDAPEPAAVPGSWFERIVA
jgi:hypothetical protein